MKTILKVLKINILSILALPILLIATASKLIAKAFEKIALMLAMTIFTILLIFLFEAVKAPGTAFQVILTIIVTLIVFSIVAALIYFIFAFAVVAWTAAISFFEWIYEFTYKGYLNLYEICEDDYNTISRMGESKIYMVICPFYSLLRGISLLITGFVYISLYLSIIACVGIVIASLVSMNQSIKAAFGINLLTYISKFNTFAIVYGVVLYLAIMATICIVLLSLGWEWHEWAKELRMTSSEYTEYVNQLRKDALTLEASEENKEYLSHLSGHINNVEALKQEVEIALSLSDNPLLRSTWSSYLLTLSEIADTFSSYNGEIPANVFKKTIPQIEKLDKQAEDIRKTIAKIKEDALNPAKTSVFFAGCNTAEKLDKRYRSLCKAYHPDSAEGDEETFKELQAEYEKMKASMS